MDDSLQRLKRELQSEKCPPDVLARVREQIARERHRPTTRLRLPALAGAAAALLLIALATFQWSNGRKLDPPPSPGARVAAANPTQVAEEARISLACIGHILLQAGRHSEAVIVKEALPPLRSGLQTVRTTVRNPTGL